MEYNQKIPFLSATKMPAVNPTRESSHNLKIGEVKLEAPWKRSSGTLRVPKNHPTPPLQNFHFFSGRKRVDFSLY